MTFPRLSGLVLTLALASFAVAADKYTVDNTHAGVSFQVAHAGFSKSHGRFNDVAGSFTIDSADPTKSSFELTIQVESIDTNNKQRDGHLKAPDFFNAKQYPTITFKSTKVEKAKEGLKVTGDLALHGKTRPVTFVLEGGKVGEFPPGTARTGYSTDLKIKRSEFGMDKFLDMIGDEVDVSISLEGTKKK